MPRSRSFLALLLVAALAPATALGAARQAPQAEAPTPGALYETGPSGRYLLGGDWLFKLDPQDQGVRHHWERSSSVSGWSTVQVPYSWNVADASDASYVGTVGWYRKDFTLPSAAAAYDWLVRFESVNYRAQAWLNGVPIGSNAGAYEAFEFHLPAGKLHRRGVNHLVVRTDNRRRGSDLPPAGFSRVSNQPTGGWWNYGGILREVYLRQVQRVDLATVQVLPHVSCASCPATVRVRATVHNYGRSAAPVRVAGRYGSTAFDLGTAFVRAGASGVLTGRVRITHPQLWSPASPRLYKVTLAASVAGRTLQTWQTRSGLRSIRVVNGRLYLNNHPLNFRGVGVHEDSLDKGSAIDNATRAKIIAAAKDLGATVIRAHYPLHPELLELADRLGVMVWSEIPMYQVKDEFLRRSSVRAKGVSMLTKSILINGNHPSIIVWSIGNELSSTPGVSQGKYISAAVRTAHALDPTRPVGQAFAGHPGQGCQKGYAPLDVLGVNEYFSWYPGPDGSTADPTLLSDYLDTIRACYPGKAIVVTETGAEANRDGPAEERGTYAFQQAYANFQFAVIDSKTWLSGAIWWALQEFRVRPEWDGGNPRPSPPFHEKGLLTLTWQKKPAYFDVQRIFRATQQLGARKRR